MSNSIELKKRIVEDWLDNNGFYNIQITDNNCFMKADSRNSRMFITIADEFDLDIERIKQFAFNNKREAWVAKIIDSEKNERIEWEIL